MKKIFDENMLIKKKINHKSKMISLMILLLLTISLSVSYSFFNYSKTGSINRIVAGNIYLKATSTNIEVGSNLYPMTSSDGIVNGTSYEFTVEGYNTSTKDISYGIYLNRGQNQSGKRFRDSDLMMILKETKNNITRVVYGPGSFEEFNNTLIYANTIDSGIAMNDAISIDYELIVWVSEKVLISDNINNIEGRSIYTTGEYASSYATLNITVEGNFVEKSIDNDTVTITTKTKSDNINYVSNLSYENTNYVNDNVVVNFTINKEPSKLIIINDLNNTKSEVVPTISNNVWTYQKEESTNGKYRYYVEYEDGTISDVYYYNVKIDKLNPAFNLSIAGTIQLGSTSRKTTITNTVSNITDANKVILKYDFIEQGQTPSNYKQVDLKGNSYVIEIKDVPSGLYQLYVKLIDESGKETVNHVSYVITKEIGIVNIQGLTLSDTRHEVVDGQLYNYIENLPNETISDYDFDGYSTDKAGVTIINNGSSVSSSVERIYANYTSSMVTYCATFVQNGASAIGSTSQCCSTSGSSCTITTPSITASSNTPTVVGWNQSSSACTSQVAQNSTLTLTGDATYYAQTSNNDVTITATFNANNATIGANNSSCIIPKTCNGLEQASSCTITMPSIERTGYTAYGWSTSNVGDSVIYPSGVSIAFDDNATYYAITAKSTSDITGCTQDDWETGRCIFKGSTVNNYIYFNCTDETDTTTCSIWRIYSREAVNSNGTLKLIAVNNAYSTIYDSSNGTLWNVTSLRTNLNGSSFYNNLKSSAKARMVLQSTKYGDHTLGENKTVADIIGDESQTVTDNVNILRLSEWLRTSSSVLTTSKEGKSGISGTFRANPSLQKSNNWLTDYLDTVLTGNRQVWSVTGTNKTLYGAGNWAIYTRDNKSDAYAVPVVEINSNVVLQGTGASGNPYYIDSIVMTNKNSSATCSITITNPSVYETAKTLTATVNTNGSTLDASPYLWSNVGSYSASITTLASVNGAVQLTVKDSYGLTSTCSTTLVSRLEYQHDACTESNSCYYCTSGVGPSPDHYCYSNLVSSNMSYSACMETSGSYYYYNNKCYASRSSAKYGSAVGYCGCKTWDSSDTEWYTNSCGSSNYTYCRDRGTRTTYAGV